MTCLTDRMQIVLIGLNILSVMLLSWRVKKLETQMYAHRALKELKETINDL